jgi:hypothetical protein
VSVPARAPRPAPAPSPRVPSRETPVLDPRRATSAQPVRRRRQHHLGFFMLATIVLGGMIFAIVLLNVLLAQQSFRIDADEQRIEELSTEHMGLVREQATLSAPGRIAAWARRNGMRLPDDIRSLHASGARAVSPAGAADPSTTGGDP